MKKTVFRRLLFFIAVMLTMLACSVAVYADDLTTTDGKWKYTVTNGEVTITECLVESGEIVIPDTIDGKPVTAIGQGAFFTKRGLTGDLTIPNTVKRIGDMAFCGCEGFNGTLTIPDSVESIGSGAFHGCSGLTGDLTIPTGVTVIKESAFEQCSGLNGNLTIPDGVTTIGVHAFSECKGLKGDLTIPDSVTDIKYYAFYRCSGFTGNLSIGDGVQEIGSRAFSECEKLTGTLTFPDGLTEIGDSAFWKCSGFTGDLTIPNTVTSMGRSAFEDCYGFSGELNISNGLTEIPMECFYKCGGFSKIVIPESVTSIGTNGVYVHVTDCRWLEVVNNSDVELDLPGKDWVDNKGASISKISKGTAKRNIILDPDPTPFRVSVDGTENGYDYNLTGGKITIVEYHGDEETVEIPETMAGGYPVTKIGCAAFLERRKLTTVKIPGSVTIIGQYAFEDLKNLRNVTIENGVTAISKQAFDGSGVTSITIPASVTTIGELAFLECRSLTDLTIEGNVTTMGKYAFWDCSGLKNVEMSNISNMGHGMFYGCSSLESITIPSSVTTFGKYVLESCNNLVEIKNDSTVSLELPDSETWETRPWKNKETGNTITEIANGTAVRDVYTYPVDPDPENPDPVNPDPSDPSQKDPNASDATDSKDDITNPYSEVHKTDGTNVAVGSVSCGNAKWIFDAEKSDTVMAVKKIDISKKFASYTKEQGYDSAANHRYMTDNKKIAKITKKGVLKLKKSGVITVTYEQKKKGESWTKIGEPVKIYIQKPEMIKKQQESFTSGGKLDAFKLLSKTTYRPTKWMSSKPSVASVDPETGEINMHKKGTVKILAIYGEGSQSTDKKIYTKLQLK